MVLEYKNTKGVNSGYNHHWYMHCFVCKWHCIIGIKFYIIQKKKNHFRNYFNYYWGFVFYPSNVYDI